MSDNENPNLPPADPVGQLMSKEQVTDLLGRFAAVNPDTADTHMRIAEVPADGPAVHLVTNEGQHIHSIDASDPGNDEGTVFEHTFDDGTQFLKSGAEINAQIGHKILEPDEHDVVPADGAYPPRSLERAFELPLAMPGETLHRIEGLIIEAFRDVGDEIRHVYLNATGNFVKA